MLELSKLYHNSMFLLLGFKLIKLPLESNSKILFLHQNGLMLYMPLKLDIEYKTDITDIMMAQLKFLKNN